MKIQLFVYSIIFFTSILTNAFAFDLDKNGLYDDEERKHVLAALSRAYPLLPEHYDQNNDGRVSISEQSSGRPPLSVLISKQPFNQEVEIPWTLDLFPEWIMTAFFQDDIEVEQLGEHQSRGVINVPAVQKNYYRQPHKKNIGGGVEFEENSSQYFTMPSQRDARWNYRWLIFAFRIDGNSGDADTTTLIDINHGNSAGYSSPKVWYSKKSGINIQYFGLGKAGLDKRIISDSKHVIGDGKTWNVLVTGIRYGKLFASVNGKSLFTDVVQPSRFSTKAVNKTTSYIGDKDDTNMKWAYDTIAFGLTEPSEAMVKKMTGWAAHRLKVQSNLPTNHPYHNKPPVMDKEDFPKRYLHDEQKWSDWGRAIKQEQVLVNAGGKRVIPEGFQRVFYDDFRDSRIKASDSSEASVWAAPGFNIAVGADAPLITPNEQNNAYLHNKNDQYQSLSLINNKGKWRGSAFYSVNDLGYGYTWSGPKIIRIRVRFPKIAQNELTGGLFPAFWSYDPDFLFWRTANRVEVDWFEFDGQNGAWLNGLASHYHYANIKSVFAKNANGYKSYKAYSGDLMQPKSKIPGGLYVWDGEFHTWEFVVETDMTYINVTIQDQRGKEQWVEIGRVKTPDTYLQKLDLQVNLALIAKHGVPVTEQYFTIDWIEVLQKNETLDSIPTPFIDLPSLQGEQKVGSLITCDTNIKNINDLRYYWFIDGYPLGYSSNSQYKLSNQDKGKMLRCMVKAVGALNSPEAWSKPLHIAF